MPYKLVIMIGKNHSQKDVDQLKQLAESDGDIVILGDGNKDINLDLSKIEPLNIDEKTLFVVWGHGSNSQNTSSRKESHSIDGNKTSELFAKIRSKAEKPVTIAGFSCFGGAVIKQNEITADGVLAFIAAGSKYTTRVNQNIKSIQNIIKLKKQSPEVSNLQIFKYLVDNYPQTIYLFDNQERKEEEDKKPRLSIPSKTPVKIARPGKFTKEEILAILDNIYPEGGSKKQQKRRASIIKKLISDQPKTRVGADKTTFSIQGIKRIIPDLDPKFIEELEKKLSEKFSLDKISKPRAEDIFKGIESVTLIEDEKEKKEEEKKEESKAPLPKDQQLIVDLLNIESARGTLEVVEGVIKEHKKLIGEYGERALFHAVKYGHKEIAEALIEAGAKVNQQAEDGWTYLMIAAQRGNQEIVEALIQVGADLNLQSKDGGTALMIAVQHEHKEIVEALAAKVDISLLDEDSRTALMFFAAKNGCTKVTQALIDAKANLDVQDKDGCTALMIAVKRGYTKIVEALIGAKANLDVQDKDGRTALMIVAKDGDDEDEHEQIAKALIGAKANLDVQDKDGLTALMIALEKLGQGAFVKEAEVTIEIAKALITAGTNLNLKDQGDRTALMIASGAFNQLDLEELIKAIKEGEEKELKKKGDVTPSSTLLPTIPASAPPPVPQSYTSQPETSVKNPSYEGVKSEDSKTKGRN